METFLLMNNLNKGNIVRSQPLKKPFWTHKVMIIFAVGTLCVAGLIIGLVLGLKKKKGGPNPGPSGPNPGPSPCPSGYPGCPVPPKPKPPPPKPKPKPPPKPKPSPPPPNCSKPGTKPTKCPSSFSGLGYCPSSSSCCLTASGGRIKIVQCPSPSGYCSKGKCIIPY